jgi:hypothetical protein
VVTDANGQFTVKLQAFANPAAVSTTYTGKVQAEERGTVTIPTLSVNLATIFGGPTNLGNIVLSDTGTVNVTVNDVSTSSPTGAKLSIYGPQDEQPDLAAVPHPRTSQAFKRKGTASRERGNRVSSARPSTTRRP